MPLLLIYKNTISTDPSYINPNAAAVSRKLLNLTLITLRSATFGLRSRGRRPQLLGSRRCFTQLASMPFLLEVQPSVGSLPPLLTTAIHRHSLTNFRLGLPNLSLGSCSPLALPVAVHTPPPNAPLLSSSAGPLGSLIPGLGSPDTRPPKPCPNRP